MYTINELYNLSEKPKINEINLYNLIMYAESYLEPYEFKYFINDEHSTEIKLRFPKNHTPHLLGIETIAKKSGVSWRDLKNFKGDVAYSRMVNKEITFESLKGMHRKTFNSLKDKYLFFYQIPHLVTSTKVVCKYTPAPNSRIECEFLIYTGRHNAMIHLGLEKVDSGEYYIARTFLIERNLGEKQIDAQKDSDKMKILKIQKISIETGTIEEKILSTDTSNSEK